MTGVRQGFPKSARLLSATDYSSVFDDAVAVSNAAFTVLCRANGLNRPRLGLAIAKKRLRRAVDRNLVRRIVRESFRRNRVKLAGRDYVVLARSGLRVGQRKATSSALEQLWERSIKRCPLSPLQVTKSA